MNISNKQKLIIGIFCLLIAFVIFKVEVLDHQWFLVERNTQGYVGGWYTVEDAMTKDARWHTGRWDFKKLNENSFMFRQHVNVLIGYVLPLAFLCSGIILMISLRKSQE